MEETVEHVRIQELYFLEMYQRFMRLEAGSWLGCVYR